MEESLITDLRATTALTVLLGVHNGRALIDWAVRPDKSGLPAVTMQRITTDKIYSHSGPVSLTGARVQFDCWATSYGVSRLIFRQLDSAIYAGGTGWRGFLESSRDFAPENLDGGQRVFRASGDFNIWFKE